jgi:hypothetical protein
LNISNLVFIDEIINNPGMAVEPLYQRVKRERVAAIESGELLTDLPFRSAPT